jgi:hypothetical protein
MNYLKLALALVLFASLPAAAQDADPRFQAKTVLRPTVNLDNGWYVASWSITNFRQDDSDNTNVMLGIGRRQDKPQPKWWFEVMAMKQYAMRSNQWLVDTRAQVMVRPKVRLFIETAPYLERKAVFHYWALERRTGRWNWGAESENVFRSGRDSVGIGPRAGLAIAKIGKSELNASIAYQFRPNEPDFVRLYLALPVPLR